MTPNTSLPWVLRIAFLLGLSSTLSFANVQLPAIISDHMVLQKAANVPIWGKADPGENVTVTLGQYTARTKAGADGKWRANLDLKNAAQGPFQLVVQGKNKATIEDVLVGEVWVASGQSNMEFTLKGALGAEEEITASANPLLRQFLVQKFPSAQPLNDTKGQWVLADPKTSGGFTAVGYYFAKKLQNDLKVPVAIIHSSWGGSPSEAWTSSQGFDRDPELKASKERIMKQIQDFPALANGFIREYGEWLKTTHREDRPSANAQDFTGESVATEGWTPVKIPGSLPSVGVIWLRKEFDAPENAAGRPMPLSLGPIDETNGVACYLNGQLVKELSFKDTGTGLPHGRSIPAWQIAPLNIPAGIVKAGKNVLVIRTFSPVNPMAFAIPIKAGTQNLSSDWLAKVESELPALSETERNAVPKIPASLPMPQYTATYLFNGMIQPILPYAIRGVIWYQGEANVDRAVQHRTAFPLLIEDWRQHWGQGEFPFYFCQLANFQAKTAKIMTTDWAELREAQNMTLKLPKTGQAVLIDIGDAKNIHPRNKKDAGERLAFIALANDYGKNIPFSGPVYQSQNIEGGKIRLKFTHAEGGLVAKPLPATYVQDSAKNETDTLVRNSPNSQLEGFAICGADQNWVWADAKIEMDTVVVSADTVPNPVAVRYAWANNPTCNLYNGAGLPASPFRTDDFPAATKNGKY